MAQPNPIFVTPSTTLVQVPTLQTPYTPVLLNAIQYAGQVVTVLDATSSLGVLESSIVISTSVGNAFANGSVSTLINQPQGFLTLQSYTPSTWVSLNSYPFRNQFLSAGVANLTVSTFYTAVTSTVQEIASSLTVQNLIVSGFFNQQAGLIVNNTFSSLGTVELFSSASVWDRTQLFSSLQVQGALRFASSVSVETNFLTKSSFTAQSTVFVSSSVSVIGSFSTGQLRLLGGLEGTDLQIQRSTPYSFQAAGLVKVGSLLSTLSSAQIGTNLETTTLRVGGTFSTLSSFAGVQDFRVFASSVLQRSFSNQQSLSVEDSMTVQDALNVIDIWTANGALRFEQPLFVGTSLSTNTLNAGAASFAGNLRTLSTTTSADTLTVIGSVGLQNLLATSTSVGSLLSTSSHLSFSTAFAQGGLYINGSLSTVNTFSVLSDVYASTLTASSMVVSTFATINDYIIDTKSIALNQCNYGSTLVEGDLSVEGSFTGTGLVNLDSIQLPSTVVANNFIVSTFSAGYRGIVASNGISSLFASTVTVGSLDSARATMDMNVPLVSPSLSTFELSTGQLQVGQDSYPSTTFQLKSSLGVLTTASTGTLDVNAIAYLLSNAIVDQTLSSGTVYGTSLSGKLIGSALLLSNLNYPAYLSTLTLSTAKIGTERMNVQAFVTSTGIVTSQFQVLSTLKVGDFAVYGNARSAITTTSSIIYTTTTDASVLNVNGMNIYGDTQGFVVPRVYVNSNYVADGTNYALSVFNSMRLTGLISPNYITVIDTYRADRLVAQTVGNVSANTLVVSSFQLGPSSGSFFLPEGYSPIRISTGFVQTVQSTLRFNSSLIVDQAQGYVGILTEPNFELDVRTEAQAKSLIVTSEAVTQSQVTLDYKPSSFWYGVKAFNGGNNLYWSADGSSWTLEENRPGTLLFSVATDGGTVSQANNVLTSQTLWLLGGRGAIYYRPEGTPTWQQAFINVSVQEQITDIQYNGSYWLATSWADFSQGFVDPFGTIIKSTDGISWEGTKGGFNGVDITSLYGGQNIAWNGSLWVAVGQGNSPANCVLYSSNGFEWSNCVSGGPFGSNMAKGVVWAGGTWVISGNYGYISSFAYSSNGVSWTCAGSYGFSSNANALATDGSIIVAVGTPVDSQTSIQFSADFGRSWQMATGDLFINEAVSVKWNGSYFLASGREGGSLGLRKSYDGRDWFQVGIGSDAFTGFAWSSNALPSLTVGTTDIVSASELIYNNFCLAGGTTASSDSNCLRYSLDGKNWTPVQNGFTVRGNGSAFNGSNQWVATGSNTVGCNILRSDDGQTWLGVIFANIVFNVEECFDVTFGSNTFAVAGTGTPAKGVFFSEDNAATFYEVKLTNGFTVAYGIANDGNGNFCAVGSQGSGLTIARNSGPSAKGAGNWNWTNSGLINPFSAEGRGITYGASTWVAVGEDATATIKYSSDRSTWTDATSGAFSVKGYGVAYNGSLWVAVGDDGGGAGSIKYTTDYTTWSNSESGAFSNAGRSVKYNAGLGLWLAAGSNESLKYSPDGRNWYNATSGAFDLGGFGIGSATLNVSSATTYTTQLQCIPDPGPGVLTRDLTPVIGYGSTLNLNTALRIDTYKNIVIASPLQLSTLSTFYQTGIANISTFVSTTSVRAGGIFASLETL